MRFKEVYITRTKVGQIFLLQEVRGMFFNSCHLLDYFSRGLTVRKLFVCGESPIFSDQISIKIVAL